MTTDQAASWGVRPLSLLVNVCVVHSLNLVTKAAIEKAERHFGLQEDFFTEVKTFIVSAKSGVSKGKQYKQRQTTSKHCSVLSLMI